MNTETKHATHAKPRRSYEVYMQQPDPQPGHYYVTAIDGDRAYFLAGPWPEHAQALAQVDAVRRFAERADPRAVWMAFGTARRPIGAEPRKSALGSDPQKWSVE